MFETEAHIYDFLFNYLHQLTADLSDADLAKSPGAGLNPPLWILGHLSVINDYGLLALGAAPISPPEWSALFNTKSDPAKLPVAHPSKQTLLATLERGHAALVAAVKTADPAKMAKPHGSKLLEGSPIKTVGQSIAHIMTSHLATHLGQLSVYRRLRGLPPLF